MKWLEVIRLRSAEKCLAVLDELLISISKVDQTGLAEMKVYRHADLETDFSLHLYWDAERMEQQGSTLGLRLTQALKKFGLVDHSVWIEENQDRSAS